MASKKKVEPVTVTLPAPVINVEMPPAKKEKRVRMNNKYREAAIDALYDAATKNMTFDIKARVSAAADAVINEFLGKHAATFHASPKEWHQETISIDVVAGGWKTRLVYGERLWKEDRYEHKEAKIVPHNLHNDRYVVQDEKLIKEIQQIELDKKAHNENLSKIKGQIISAVNGFGTVNSLLEALPELRSLPDAEPLLTALEQDRPKDQLVPAVADVRKLLGSVTVS